MLKIWSVPLLMICSLLFQHEPAKNETYDRLAQHAHSLKDIASRKNRFFVVNLQNDSILLTGLCAHGQGDDVNREEVVFSNTPGSYCTSQGRYKLGVKFEGDYGTGYILHGLDSTNSNALKREVVFHYYFKVADKEDENVVCRSNGCPMVSQKTFRATEKLIDAETKPVLMWIYK